MSGLGIGHGDRKPTLWLDEERVKEREREMKVGIPVPDADTGQSLGDGDLRVVTVASKSPASWHKVAHQVSVVAKRDMQLTATAWGQAESGGRSRPHAFVLIKDRYAIGLMVVRRRYRWEEVSWEKAGGTVRPSRHAEPRWTADIIWIARSYRKMGYGRLLINMALFHLETEAEEMAWGLPISPGGERLIRSFTGDQKLYVA